VNDPFLNLGIGVALIGIGLDHSYLTYLSGLFLCGKAIGYLIDIKRY